MDDRMQGRNFRGENLQEAREQLVNALKATKSWLTGYAEAYLDDFIALATAPAAVCETCKLPLPVAGVAGHPMEHCACARLILPTKAAAAPILDEVGAEDTAAVERACLAQFGPQWGQVRKHTNSRILFNSVKRGLQAARTEGNPDAVIDDAAVERACLAQFGAVWGEAQNSHNRRILADSVRQGLVAAQGTPKSAGLAVNETDNA